MKYFSAYFCGILILFAGNAAAENSGATRIYTVPAGRDFSVDGILYTGPTAQMWAAGSKHVLSVQPQQHAAIFKTRYEFTGWRYAGGELSKNATVQVTADPTLTEFYAEFDVSHAVSLQIARCGECPPVGTVYVNDQPYTADADVYFSHGAKVMLRAEPAPGFAFEGWGVSDNQTITGFLNAITLLNPITVRPKFVLARRIQLTTEPADLDVYADRGRVRTPIALDWVHGTTHTLGVPSPQSTLDGKWWVFSRWADDAPENRTYTVEPGSQVVTLTAVFVPALVTQFATSPRGLKLIVDGRDNWPQLSFPWGEGEQHRFEAPEQQTDEQGRLWRFVSWSNGGPRAQNYVAAPHPNGEMTQLVAKYEAVGRLTVTSAVAGLSIQVDGADCATPCDVQRPVGTVVRVSAPASLRLGNNSRADFEGWPGSGSLAAEWSVTLKEDPARPHLTYRTMHRLMAWSNPADSATWRMEPDSADGFYAAEERVTVTAVARPGFRFRHWSGDASGSAPAASVAMSAPRGVEATMERVPHIAPAGVGNAAGGVPESGVAPGSIVSIFGAGFAPETAAGPENPLAQAIGCITVRSGGRLMPLYFVSPAQINFHLPDDTPVGEQKLTVSCQGMPEVEAEFRVARNAPGLFAGAVLHEDGSAVTEESPARRGELLTAYGTGFGPAVATRPFGLAPLEAAAIADAVSVQAEERTIAPERAFAAANRPGLDAVQFRLPEAVAAGAVKVAVTVNGVSSNAVSIAVR
jgi:uncharacterized protein (TIGR03437 family)